jgi:hypothetical protein
VRERPELAETVREVLLGVSQDEIRVFALGGLCGV